MIDTAVKRASCLGIALLFLRTGVMPDGNNLATAAERQQAEGLYVGLGAAPPVETTVGPYKLTKAATFLPGSVATAVWPLKGVTAWDA